jgi:hypothetical protein
VQPVAELAQDIVVEAFGEAVKTEASVKVPKAVEPVLVLQLITASTLALTVTADVVAAVTYSG